MNELEESSTFHVLKFKVGHLGSDMKEVYDASMDRVKGYQLGRFEALGIKVLMWIVYAKRQLRVEELLEVYIASRSQDDFDDEERELLSPAHLTASTMGLIETHDETRNVSIHKSLQDYFDHGGKKESYFNDAEYDISRSCMKYLRFKRFAIGHCSSKQEWEERVSKKRLPRIFRAKLGSPSAGFERRSNRQRGPCFSS
jgi:hypothetical protein